MALLSPYDSQSIFGFLDWPGSDKVIHALLFLIFSLALSLSLTSSNLALVLFIGSIYGIIIELIQIIMPGRSFEKLDWVADVAGTLLGYFAFIYLSIK